MLATSSVGDGPTLVIAHGLFGSGRNWGAVAKRLATRRRVVTVDMRNHGDSPWTDTHSYQDLAADLAQIDGPFDLMGHSMGGKAAMALALTGGRVRRLIVADIAPVTYAHSQLFYIDAMEAVDLAGVTRRSEADARLAPLVPEAPIRAFLLQSLKLDPPRWGLNLGTLRSEMPKIMGFPDLPGSFGGPALFLRGGGSDYVPDSAIPAIRAKFPGAVVETIAGAGHWIHAEKPRDVVAAVERFLA